jgi:broad specificity phosphatase PhoE
MRHAQTEPGIGDPPGFVLGRCDTQRNLSDAGRAEARRFGERLAARFGPPSAIRASRWCRGLDTAAGVALGLGTGAPAIDAWPVLDSFFEGRGDAAAQTAAARQRLRTLAAARGYELWVTHQVNVSALCGESLPMGGALWLQAAADGGVRAFALDP